MGWFRRRKQAKLPKDPSIQRDPDGTVVVRLNGVLSRAGLAMIQQCGLRELETYKAVRLLVVLNGFTGWQRGAEMGDVRFLLQHDSEAIMMAIVGDPKWEDDFLLFTGASHRRARIEFFPDERLEQARAWLRMGEVASGQWMRSEPETLATSH